MNVRTAGQSSRSRTLALCMLVICTKLTACGQLGPLYLPGDSEDTAPAASTSTDESATEERDNDDKPDGL